MQHPEVTVGLQFEMKVNRFKNSDGQEQIVQEVQVNTIVPGGAADKVSVTQHLKSVESS